MAGGSIAVEDTLGGHRIDHALGGAQLRFGLALVACRDRLAHFLNCRTKLGTLCGIVRVTLDGLPRALARLGGVGHYNSLKFAALARMEKNG